MVELGRGGSDGVKPARMLGGVRDRRRPPPVPAEDETSMGGINVGGVSCLKSSKRCRA